jgi:hypothetical protein
MYMHHYELAFILKKKAKEIPLWVIFIISKIKRMKFLANQNP